jgi:hypothetical protein
VGGQESEAGAVRDVFEVGMMMKFDEENRKGDEVA